MTDHKQPHKFEDSGTIRFGLPVCGSCGDLLSLHEGQYESVIVASQTGSRATLPNIKNKADVDPNKDLDGHNSPETNPRISEIVTRFSGKTFSSHQDVLDWLTTTLEAFEREVREEERNQLPNAVDNDGNPIRIYLSGGNHDQTK